MVPSLIIFTILNVILGISILIYYFMHFKDSNKYFKYSVIPLFIVIALDTITIVNLDINSILTGVLSIISYIKFIVYTCVGMYMCSVMNIVDMPLLRKLFKNNSEKSTNVGEIIYGQSYELAFKEDNKDINVKSYVIYTLLVIITSVLFSVILFKITLPNPSEAIRSILGEDSSQINKVTPTLPLICLVLSAVITEELVFRFVIQNYIAKVFKLNNNKYWLAIIFSAFLWAIAHGNTLDPEWIKFAQIFPIGLALGALYKKFGLECCIFAHGGFNIIMMFIGLQ